jgi:hypothetical protein
MSRKQTLITAVLFIVLLVAASAPSYYFYTQYKKAQDQLKNPQKAAETEIKALTGRLGQLMELPNNEQPTVATVTDKEKLKEQPFFSRTEVGDKVLIYTGAKKAILYRPGTNKIIEVGPVSITPQQGAASPAPDANTDNPATSAPTATTRPATP